MLKTNTFSRFCAMLLTAVLLSSCSSIPIQSTDIELTLKSGERWEIQTNVTMSGIASLALSQFESNLDQYLAQYKSQGIVASWSRLPQKQGDTGIGYQIQMRGSGYQLLNQTLFNNQLVVSPSSTDANQVDFHYSPDSSTYFQGQHNTFRLVSKKVVDSNGLLLNDTTVSWNDPTGTMIATALVAQDLSLLWIILLALGGVGLIISGFGISGRLPDWRLNGRPMKPTYPETPSYSCFNTKYCVKCGALNPNEATFCTSCGTEIPS